jgi:hypothetical protein
MQEAETKADGAERRGAERGGDVAEFAKDAGAAALEAYLARAKHIVAKAEAGTTAAVESGDLEQLRRAVRAAKAAGATVQHGAVARRVAGRSSGEEVQALVNRADAAQEQAQSGAGLAELVRKVPAAEKALVSAGTDLAGLRRAKEDADSAARIKSTATEARALQSRARDVGERAAAAIEVAEMTAAVTEAEKLFDKAKAADHEQRLQEAVDAATRASKMPAAGDTAKSLRKRAQKTADDAGAALIEARTKRQLAEMSHAVKKAESLFQQAPGNEGLLSQAAEAAKSALAMPAPGDAAIRLRERAQKTADDAGAALSEARRKREQREEAQRLRDLEMAVAEAERLVSEAIVADNEEMLDRARKSVGAALRMRATGAAAEALRERAGAAANKAKQAHAKAKKRREEAEAEAERKRIAAAEAERERQQAAAEAERKRKAAAKLERMRAAVHSAVARVEGVLRSRDLELMREALAEAREAADCTAQGAEEIDLRVKAECAAQKCDIAIREAEAAQRERAEAERAAQRKRAEEAQEAAWAREPALRLVFGCAGTALDSLTFVFDDKTSQFYGADGGTRQRGFRLEKGEYFVSLEFMPDKRPIAGIFGAQPYFAAFVSLLTNSGREYVVQGGHASRGGRMRNVVAKEGFEIVGITYGGNNGNQLSGISTRRFQHR